MSSRLPWIVGVALVLAFTAGLLIAKRVMPAVPQASSATGAPLQITSGKGVTIKFSDKPVALPEMSLIDLDGKPIRTDAWHGKVVLLNFWATWCGPCKEEIPALIALQEHYRNQLVIVGLSIDTAPAADVKKYVTGVGVNYPVAIVSEKQQSAFGNISAVPATFVVNPDGRIVTRHVGMIDPALIEHEVRVLANLPSDATVQTVKDTGQVLLSNAAYATEIPGLDLDKLTPQQKEEVLKRLNTDSCTCGCGLTLAQCRINDPGCQVSLPIAQKLLAKVAK
jgi:thiol-disulfide isomerase/thioredoxin